MFIAHAPSGYILAASLLKRIKGIHVSAAIVVSAGILGALAPDFDMVYFYLVDGRQTHHHKYISHWPLTWFILLFGGLLWQRLNRNGKAPLLLVVFSLGGILHVILDSLVGDIWWFAPFIDRPYALFTVPALFKPWWLNFILHWSFAVELAICLWALVVYRKRSNHSVQVQRPGRAAP